MLLRNKYFTWRIEVRNVGLRLARLEEGGKVHRRSTEVRGRFRIYICIVEVTMNFAVSGFDWDDGNRAKCEKHGVSITEIEVCTRGR